MKFSPLYATCPHCFGRFSMLRSVFRCSADTCIARKDLTLIGAGGTENYSKGDKLNKKRDPLLEDIWGDANPYNHTFSAFGLTPPVPFFGSVKKRVLCPASRQPTTDRLCPICHKSLYSQFGESVERRLTLIGAKDAGKSNYIGVLVNELEAKLGSRFGFGVQRMNQYTSTKYDDEYFEPIYRRRERVAGTDRVRSKSESIAPMVFGLKSISQRGFSTLSLFDPPGEGVIQERDVERFHQFVFKSHGLVLLVDGENLAKDDKSGGSFKEATTVLEVAGRQLEADRSWTNQLRPYLAVAVSKADLLSGLQDMPAQTFTRPSYDQGYDWSDYRIVSSGVEALIRRRGGSNFCNVAQAVFGEDRVGFFAVSAFGSAPDERTGKITTLEPLRVVDPFLWLMSKTGVLSTIGGPS